MKSKKIDKVKKYVFRSLVMLASILIILFLLGIPIIATFFMLGAFFYSFFLCTRKIYRLLIDVCLKYWIGFVKKKNAGM